MATKLVRTVFTLLTLAVLLASCSEYEEKRESRSLLASAAQAMESNPKLAQSLLKSVKTELLNDADYAYYVLLQTRVAGRNSVDIAPLGMQVAQSVNYFTAKGDAPKAAFACFVLAKVYEAQGNLTKAQFYCLDADEWAGKADNRIPDFLYSAIPYNIALYYKKDGQYEQSLTYLEKALTYIALEKSDYQDKLYALELKALNYKNLTEPENALRYYDEALAIASQYKDTLGINRILYNKYLLLSNSKDNVLAEKRCKELLLLLNERKDSLHVGLLHLSLARIYAESSKTDSSLVQIHEAERLLHNNANSHIRITLLERLYLIEQQKGSANASRYKRQYDDYKTQLERKRKGEEAEVAQLARARTKDGEWLATSLVYKDIGRTYHAESRRQGWLALGVLVVLIGGIYALVLLRSWLRLMASPPGPIPEFCREELLAYARRSASLNAIRKGADRICPSEDQVGRVAYMLDDLVPPDDWSWRRLSPTASCSYAELVGMLRRDFPHLNEKELEICALLYTQRLKARQVADIVHVELPQFKEQRKSMKHKLREAGYTSRGIRKYVKRRIE